MKGSNRLTAGLPCLLFAGTALAQSATGICGLPSQVSIHALTTDNVIFSSLQGTTRADRITGIDGNLTGIDFRVSDGPTGKLYGLTDTGKLYQISIDPQNPQAPTLVSILSPRFAGGFQSLTDFNPVLQPNANALRLIGSNDQNFAVVDSGGTLNTTAVQTAVAYVQGDTFFGVDPNLTAGAYDNNAAGATFTTFYAIDYDLDTLVTIADRNATGSSNTGGGKLKTIGPLVDPQGQPINFAPNAGLDVYTQFGGGNSGLPSINQAVAISGRTLYCINLSSFDNSFPPGSLQKVVATPVVGPAVSAPDPSNVTGGFIDVAINPFAPAAPPSADVAIQVSDSPDPVKFGGVISYQVTVSNSGPQTAGDVNLSAAQSPAGITPTPILTFVSASPSQGTCASTGAGSFNITCSLGKIAVGAPVTVIIKVSVNASGKTTLSVSSTFLALSSTVSDPNTNNNAVISTTGVTF